MKLRLSVRRVVRQNHVSLLSVGSCTKWPIARVVRTFSCERQGNIAQEARRLIMEIQEQVTLYNRLGGVYNIATVVDDFIDRIMVDPRLNANPRVDEAHHRVLPPGFKYLVTEMVGWASGGPQQYSGRSMEDTHRDLMIS